LNEEIKMKRTAALECVRAFDSSELSARYNSGAGSYEAVRQYLMDCCWKFGTNRVNMILARTVLYKSWDGRFTSDVRKWANENAGKVSRLEERIAVRKKFYKRQNRAANQIEIDRISEEIKALRKELKLIEHVRTDAPELQEKKNRILRDMNRSMERRPQTQYREETR